MHFFVIIGEKTLVGDGWSRLVAAVGWLISGEGNDYKTP